jgi:UDP-N-acetylglucosamine acyltransferase
MALSAPIIHPTAVIDPSAQLAAGVQVGPYALIGPRVTLGEGCVIAGHAVVGSDAALGRRNIVHHHAVLGTDSQDRKFRGETTGLVIGDDNVFREFVSVNRATGAGKATRIGNGCLLLAYTHVAHNCVVGNEVILSNSVQIGGECVVEDYAIVGGLVGIHQFCRVGAYAIVGGCSKVTQDILPFLTADGHPARPHGLNLTGLRRRKFAPEVISILKKVYQRIFERGLLLQDALEGLTRDYADCPEVQRLVAFAGASRRNIARPRETAGHSIRSLSQSS